MKVESGADVVINPADFKDAMALKNAIAKEISKSDMEMTIDKDGDMGDLIRLAALVDSSDEVRNALFKCLGRCTYNGHRITEDTFEPVQARADYYDIVIACVKENLTPFFKGLLSKLKPLMAKVQTQNIQSQK